MQHASSPSVLQPAVDECDHSGLGHRQFVRIWDGQAAAGAQDSAPAVQVLPRDVLVALPVDGRGREVKQQVVRSRGGGGCK